VSLAARQRASAGRSHILRFLRSSAFTTTHTQKEKKNDTHHVIIIVIISRLLRFLVLPSTRAKSRKATLDEIRFSEERDAQAFVVLRRRRRVVVVLLLLLESGVNDDG